MEVVQRAGGVPADGATLEGFLRLKHMARSQEARGVTRRRTPGVTHPVRRRVLRLGEVEEF